MPAICSPRPLHQPSSPLTGNLHALASHSSLPPFATLALQSANPSPLPLQDEITCIGCKQCVWCAPATFRIEQEFGRSRVFAQWLDTEDNLQARVGECGWMCGCAGWVGG